VAKNSTAFEEDGEKKVELGVPGSCQLSIMQVRQLRQPIGVQRHRLSTNHCQSCYHGSAQLQQTSTVRSLLALIWFIHSDGP